MNLWASCSPTFSFLLACKRELQTWQSRTMLLLNIKQGTAPSLSNACMASETIFTLPDPSKRNKVASSVSNAVKLGSSFRANPAKLVANNDSVSTIMNKIVTTGNAGSGVRAIYIFVRTFTKLKNKSDPSHTFLVSIR
jgi:hypothetical protein